MKLDLATVCYNAPGLRWLGALFTPPRLFHISRLTAKLSLRLYLHTRRFLQPLHQLLRASGSNHDLTEISEIGRASCRERV